MKESLKVRFKKKIKFSNVMVCVVTVMLVLFTLRILHIVEQGFMEPSTLIGAVFAAGLGEFGILGYIKGTKIKNDYYNNDTIQTPDDNGVG